MKWLLSFLFIFFTYTANADFLIVQRIGNLRKTPSTVSEILEKIHTGDTLFLVDQFQTGGYYHVISVASQQEGWVYRTLVRRVSGVLDIPETAELNPGIVDIRVLDVGPGLCTLIKLPGNKFVIYDAGGEANSNGDSTLAQIRDYITPGSEIELMVLSHTDADHIVAASKVIRDYRVKKVLWTGYERSMISDEEPTRAFDRLAQALRNNPEIENVNLNEEDSIISPGNELMIGNASFRVLCGFGEPLPEWGLNDRGEKLNAVSIVMKLSFAERSVLFCGDAVGRHRDDSANALMATEQFLVEKADSFLKSTIIIAPHHGARNGSATAFVDKVQPEWVVFSAGHKFNHPDTRTANQYLRFTPSNKILRTDRCDDEGGTEWQFLRVPGCRDRYKDDSIQIQLRSNHSFRVFYLNEVDPCQ